MTAAAATSPLSIAVIGAGGIGSAFAYRLAGAGHPVTVIARPGSNRLAQLQRDAGVADIGGEARVMGVADHLDEQAAFDLVLVTVLAHQVDAVLPALARSQARSIQFMFNTFDPERVQAALGGRPCSFGMPFLAASLDAEGRLDSRLNPVQKTLHGDQRWADLFLAAGMPSVFEPDMPLWLRCHAPVCAAMESICVAGQRRGGGASWRQAMVVARGMQAALAMIKSLGHRLHPPAKAGLAASPRFVVASLLWSVSRIRSFRELLATGANECRALVNVLAAATPDSKTAAAILAMKPADEPKPATI